MISISPIGLIHSSYKEKFLVPRQSGLEKNICTIEITEYPEEALRGLGNFSHLWVLFYFHLIDQENSHQSLIRPPRLGGKEKMGVLATRSMHRKNRIGQSLVRILDVEKKFIKIEGGDFVNGTPVLDIKPLIKEEFNIIKNSNLKFGWTEILAEKNLPLNVIISDEVLQSIPPDDLKFIKIALSKDPRPAYKKTMENDSKIYSVYLLQYNIHFQLSYSEVHILKIEQK